MPGTGFILPALTQGLVKNAQKYLLEILNLYDTSFRVLKNNYSEFSLEKLPEYTLVRGRKLFANIIFINCCEFC